MSVGCKGSALARGPQLRLSGRGPCLLAVRKSRASSSETLSPGGAGSCVLLGACRVSAVVGSGPASLSGCPPNCLGGLRQGSPRTLPGSGGDGLLIGTAVHSGSGSQGTGKSPPFKNTLLKLVTPCFPSRSSAVRISLFYR